MRGLKYSRLLDLESCTDNAQEARSYIVELSKLRGEQLKMLVHFWVGLSITLLAGLALSAAKGEVIDKDSDGFMLGVVATLGLAALGVGTVFYARLCESTYMCIDAFVSYIDLEKINKRFNRTRPTNFN